MIGKVKQFFGIEGIKMQLILSEEPFSKKSGIIQGSLEFNTMNDQTVTSITLVLIEKYTRGRRKTKKMDEYELGSILLDEAFEVKANEIVTIDFELPFDLLQSEIDEFGAKNPLFGGIAGVAKFAQGVKSLYRIEAKATVKGTRLSPFEEAYIELK